MNKPHPIKLTLALIGLATSAFSTEYHVAIKCIVYQAAPGEAVREFGAR